MLEELLRSNVGFKMKPVFSLSCFRLVVGILVIKFLPVCTSIIVEIHPYK